MNNTQLSSDTAKLSLSQTMPVGSREFKVASRPVVSYSGTQQNELLAALPREVLESLFEHLELVTLPFGKELFEFGSKLDNVYFPTTAIVSLLYVMEDGATTEIAVVGHEGVVGVSMFPGERAMCSAVVQSAGYGYRLKAQHLREAFNQGGALPQLLMRYNHALFAQMAQNAVGGRHSSIEQKLCRWLLDRLDRSLSNELKVTQEMISIMLGVRRESITAAAGKLQEDGLITYRRGNITVIDRSGLERYAGECYKVAKTEYDRLLVDVAGC
ncbi:Crp/Fnr family transcriptional regulator [Pseudoduganella aquatica]|uniref:Helix-turn-helix domain-containing protein n=1 Tax=Pseudoduganella aquatica TaxID=2660641 RepID=A0A7X4HHC2_9BURK|nr:Crp/Fnr family transcriptional regulator [Pseudoduganella aquatica]MYN10763.1 helix-turn-helix domain-containing protein [Pseudoduganella aquatica]